MVRTILVSTVNGRQRIMQQNGIETLHYYYFFFIIIMMQNYSKIKFYFNCYVRQDWIRSSQLEYEAICVCKPSCVYLFEIDQCYTKQWNGVRRGR